MKKTKETLLLLLEVFLDDPLIGNFFFNSFYI
jgi:hypothetical protein